MNYSIETLREIWENKGDEEPVEVGPDRDGLKLVEIRRRGKDKNIIERMSFYPEEARMVAQAILDCANEISPETA